VHSPVSPSSSSSFPSSSGKGSPFAAGATGSTARAVADNPRPPGSRYPLLPNVRSRVVPTDRLAQHVYESGPLDAEPLVLLHGNVSSGRFFEDLLAYIPDDYYAVAPDLRGYGATEHKVVDATRGVRDYSDDLHALVAALGIERFHLLGWSLGGNAAMQYTIEHPERVRSLTLLATGSPYGYGCTRGSDGVPIWDDFAGSGGGLINPQIQVRYEARDDSAFSMFSPRSLMRMLYVKPTFHFAPRREDVLVEQLLLMHVGDTSYPGDSTRSPNWPYSGPGRYGPNNALSPKYINQSGLAGLGDGGPPIMWVRGTDDSIVSDAAQLDPATLGRMGYFPGWPGLKVYPPQPMLAQIRAVLDRYRSNGGTYHEEILATCGHSPHIEQPAAFFRLLTRFLHAHRGR